MTCLGKSGPHVEDCLDGLRVANGHHVGTKTHGGTISLVSAGLVQMDEATARKNEAMEIGEFGDEGTRDVLQLPICVEEVKDQHRADYQGQGRDCLLLVQRFPLHFWR